MNRRFAHTGEIRDVDLLAAFVALWKERGSVTLEFTRGAISAGFDVSDGEVVSTFSADPRFETSAILVRAGKLDIAALDRLSTPEGSDRAMAAMQTGVLTRREWKWGEKIRAIEVLSDLLTWNDGRYAALPDTRSAAGEFRLPIPRMLLELFLRSRDRALVEHQLGNADAPLERTADFEEEFATFGLTADAESVVHLIDGRSSARKIASKAPADPFAVEKLLAGLVTLDLVRPVGGVEAPPAPQAAVLPLAAPMSEPIDERRHHESLEATAPELALPDPGPAAPEQEESPFDKPEDFEAEALDAAGAEPELPQRDAGEWDTLAPGPADPVLERVDEPAAEPPRRGSGPLLAGLFAVLVAAVAAVLLFRSRSGGSGTATKAAEAQRTPTAIVEAAAATPVPTEPSPTAIPVATARPAKPTKAPPTPRPTKAAPAARPTATAARAPAATPAPAGAPAAAPAPGDRKAWLARAESGRQRLASEPGTRYAIQLLLACEVSTLEDAFRHEQPAGSMWVLASDHKGRTCFKVLWGRFGSAEEAKKAKDRIPAHFVTPANKPAVVAVR